jgi:hypothetical protein
MAASTRRAGAGHEYAARLPPGAAADPLHVLPRLGNHAGRLEQHADPFQGWIDTHRVLRLDAIALRAEAVSLLDAAFRIEAVAAHVPLTAGAIRARHRVGAAHNRHDQIAGLQSAVWLRLEHPA